jgi:peptide/nickel transport system permease protein
MTVVPLTKATRVATLLSGRKRARRPSSSVLRRLLRNRSAAFGGAVLIAAALAAVFAGAIFDADPLDMVGRPYTWPFTDRLHPLGTDMLGRDILVGLVYAARVSLTVGFAAAALSTILGVSLGVLAGYFGGWTDGLISRLTEVFQTMPPLILAVVVVTVLSPSVGSIACGIGIASWPQIARIVRAETLRLRDSEFVQAAVSVGEGHLRIVAGHILPNALPQIVVTGSILVATAILTEAALAFLGLGDPNEISWGSMIGAGREAMRTAWYMTALPGLAITAVVLSLNLLADGLNDVLNPRAGNV